MALIASKQTHLEVKTDAKMGPGGLQQTVLPVSWPSLPFLGCLCRRDAPRRLQ